MARLGLGQNFFTRIPLAALPSQPLIVAGSCSNKTRPSRGPHSSASLTYTSADIEPPVSCRATYPGRPCLAQLIQQPISLALQLAFQVHPLTLALFFFFLFLFFVNHVQVRLGSGLTSFCETLLLVASNDEYAVICHEHNCKQARFCSGWRLFLWPRSLRYDRGSRLIASKNVCPSKGLGPGLARRLTSLPALSSLVRCLASAAANLFLASSTPFVSASVSILSL